jgi:hypothetical protein
MIARQPYLPRMVAGGPGNPLGARVSAKVKGKITSELDLLSGSTRAVKNDSSIGVDPMMPCR